MLTNKMIEEALVIYQSMNEKEKERFLRSAAISNENMSTRRDLNKDMEWVEDSRFENLIVVTKHALARAMEAESLLHQILPMAMQNSYNYYKFVSKEQEHFNGSDWDMIIQKINHLLEVNNSPLRV